MIVEKADANTLVGEMGVFHAVRSVSRIARVNVFTVLSPLQICSGRKSVLEGYGEIIFRAWKETTGPCLLELETTCIQVSL